ncbi:MAG: hypothetical protein HRT61_21420 [Ekhidna sp.]|nr:hypothetical protein [Ekhidna sp.]
MTNETMNTKNDAASETLEQKSITTGIEAIQSQINRYEENLVNSQETVNLIGRTIPLDWDDMEICAAQRLVALYSLKMYKRFISDLEACLDVLVQHKESL